ncbi:FAD-dependent oxidoreductase [Chloroflexota bacterium]
MEFKKLFEPMKIGPLEVKNRIAMIPMNIHFSENGGYTGDEYKALFSARAKGGFGLLFYGAVLASERAARQQGLLITHCFDIFHVHGLSNLTEAVHTFGSKIIIQLSPGFGRQQRHSKQPGWAPSLIQLNKEWYYGNRVHVSQKFKDLHPDWLPTLVGTVMTAEQIQLDIDEFILATDLALTSGFDGIEIHTGHGYLIHQFLSPLFNKRTDEYGGSLENRCRYLTELLDALRKKYGTMVPISVRFSGADHLPGGLTAEDFRDIARLVVPHGVDIIDLTDGTTEAQNMMTPARDHVHILAEQGRKMKEAVGIPIVSQSLHNPYYAEQAVANGDTDFVGLGRQSLADPEWPNKVREGRIKDIVRCNRDNWCYVCMYREVGTRCSRNPMLGKEKYQPELWPIQPPIQERVPWLIPCGFGCPAEIDANLYVHLCAEGKFAEAAAVIREKVPFPGVLGRVCPAHCEKECQRGEIDSKSMDEKREPIAIRMLKRIAVEHDTGLWKENSKIAPPTGKKVAVVGSGPAGLTAAYYLAKKGHSVTIFEALPVAGGMMQVGIPDFRLPKDLVKAEIEEIKSVGVEIKTNTKVESLDALSKQGYKAILVAIGTHSGTKIPITGADTKGILIGTSFLKDVSLNREKVKVGEKVVVLGGGSVAFDCARSARRLGAQQVHVACLECRDDMLAEPEEIEQAEEEGIIVHPSSSFVKIVCKGTRATGVECLDVKSFELKEDGTAKIVTVPGSASTLPADTVIFAVGQKPEIPSQFALTTGRGNTIKADADTLATSKKGIFAAGDAVSGTATVVEAIASGRMAAESIDKFLGGNGEIDEMLIDRERANPYDGRRTGGFDDGNRVRVPTVPALWRINNFDAIELSISDSTAIGEALRCVQCDVRIPETLRRMKYGK